MPIIAAGNLGGRACGPLLLVPLVAWVGASELA